MPEIFFKGLFERGEEDKEKRGRVYKFIF